MIKHIFNKRLLILALFLPLGYRWRPALHRMRGVKISKNVWISKYVYIDELHPEDVIIGNNSTIGYRTPIFTRLYFGPHC